MVMDGGDYKAIPPGQNRQCSGRAQDFRFAPKTRHLRV